jgi:glutaminyl-peptide cyclotransferase
MHYTYPRLIALLLLVSSCSGHKDQNETAPDQTEAANTPAVIDFRVTNRYQHDTSSYTEGLLFHDGKLFESTGTSPDMPASRHSLFGIVDLKTGKIDVKAEIDRSKYFGEGISFLGGKVYQLTWQSHVGFMYDAKTFRKIGEFSIPGDGWGMTSDGQYLIMSDGSDVLSYHSPGDFKLVKTLRVTDNNGPVANINELEYINGYLYANIYMQNSIVKIDPASGRVVGKADLSSLKKEADSMYADSEYMNGIAYDSASKKVYITGKLWPSIYEITFSN